MAIFPQGLTNVNARCNPGERSVLHQLKRCLEDDYLVWHDVPLGAQSRQPDFVILHPRWGVLLLEVKDWKKGTLGPGNRDRVTIRTPQGEVSVQHPLQQVRDAAMGLVDQMQRDPLLVHADGPFRGKLLFPYGWGVVMSHLRRRDLEGSDFDDVYPPRQTLLRDELDDGLEPAAFQQRLWGMFTVHYPFTLSLPQRDRIRWHLFPEMRVLPEQQRLDLDAAEADAVPPGPALPDLMQVMDLQQEQLARSLGEGHRVIHGAAGSGKTMILIYRAQQLAATARADRPILVLCFNRALAGRIEAQLRGRGVDERVVVRTFHAWCADITRSYQIDVPPARADQDPYALLAQAVARAVDTGRVPRGQYSALLIDEAHDFEADWLRLSAQMVDEATRSLLVLYDDTQSIYATRRRRFSLASVGIEARGRTSVLKVNYRNTAEILALAVACAEGLLQQGQAANDAVAGSTAGINANTNTGTGDGSADAADAAPIVMPTTAGRRGPMPVLLQARSEREEADALAERLQQAHAGGHPLRDMAVLCRTKRSMPAIASALRRRGRAVDSQAPPPRGIRGVDRQAAP
ncbi:MAG: NERD domain-containing protein/DEAD/DEAH box helicase, partial [Aquabacterium sp.]|nr:NERD domain-containing protein/DEAD/DEAH box helicase [Aquabacterium sp.]